MSEYILNHSGSELDRAIEKVLCGYVLPEGNINISKNGEYDVTEFSNAFVNVPIPDDYVSEQYGLTKAGRITFNVTSANGVSTEDAPLLAFTPEFVPKLIVFGITANSSNAVDYSSSYNSLIMNFWIDSSCFPIGTVNNAGRKKCAYITTSGSVNVSNNNLGFQYSPTTGKIFLNQAGNSRIPPKTATDGYYEILYWG